jgi:hypothetical protein
MLNAQAPAKNLRRNQVRNNSGRKRPGKGLRIGCDKWRESPSSEKAFAGPVRGIQKTRAPRSARGDLASEFQIIFKLTLRRLVVRFKVSWIDVIEISRAAANRPFAVAENIPRETDPGSKIIGIRFWCGKQ